jgi:copper chaperone CopZ
VGCSAGVREALTGCDGVQSVEIDFEGKIATAKTTDSFDSKKALAALVADKRFESSTVLE